MIVFLGKKFVWETNQEIIIIIIMVELVGK